MIKSILTIALITLMTACSTNIESVASFTTAQNTISTQVTPSQATEKLTALNSEFKRDIIRIADNVYVSIGYGASVFTMIEGTDGIVIVDAGQDPKWSGEALAEFRKITDKPIKAVIYTHGHGDHINGARAFVPEGKNDIQIWATENFNVETRSFNSVGITINRRRGMRQAGFALPPEKRINNGIAPAVKPAGPNAFNPSNIVLPTHSLKSDRQPLNIAGINLELVANPGETKDQIYVWYPAKKVVFAGDNFYKSWPNLYAIRGTPYRDVAEWAQGIDALLAVNADHLVGGHTRPISDATEVKSTLTTYRDGVLSIFDQTIAGINKGMTSDELAATVKLPEHFANADVLTAYYGNPEWAVRAIFSGYLGWFDGNPTNLFALAPVEEARRVSDLAGGSNKVLIQAQEAMISGDAQWVAQLCDYLLALQYETKKVRLLKAEALDFLGEQQLTATARNYYFTVAQELTKAANANAE